MGIILFAIIMTNIHTHSATTTDNLNLCLLSQCCWLLLLLFSFWHGEFLFTVKAAVMLSVLIVKPESKGNKKNL